MRHISNTYRETLLIILCSGLIVTIYFTDRGTGTIGMICISLLLVQYYLSRSQQPRKLPRELIIWMMLFLASYVVGALLSKDSLREIVELRKFVFILLGGLLFVSPVTYRNRMMIITLLFVAASVAGFIGILQYYGIISSTDERSYGFSINPTFYSALLSFVCGTAIVALFFTRSDLSRSIVHRVFLMGTIVLTFGGILFSGTRGVWIALVASTAITLFIIDRRKALKYVFFMTVVVLIAVLSSFTLRERVISIATSFFWSDVRINTTSTRLELWKGALIIFKEHPFLGVGSGDFEPEITKLISEGRLAEGIPVTIHAHNIYLQALASRGIVGFVVVAGLFTALFRWSFKEIREIGGIGAYIILLSTLLTIIGGLTDNNIDYHKYLAAFSLTVGLIGPISTHHNEGSMS